MKFMPIKVLMLAIGNNDYISVIINRLIAITGVFAVCGIVY